MRVESMFSFCRISIRGTKYPFFYSKYIELQTCPGSQRAAGGHVTAHFCESELQRGPAVEFFAAGPCKGLMLVYQHKLR
jgi:hypothetical protein